ncbi:chemotaxis protein CheW [Chloroflexota bacterium]
MQAPTSISDPVMASGADVSDPDSMSDSIPAVLCRVGDQQYAIAVTYILEVSALVQITPLPDAPPEVAGVVNRRGEVIPVLDLRLCLGAAEGVIDLTTLFIVVQEVQGTEVLYTAGLIVDEVLGVVQLPANTLQLTTHSGPFIKGMTVVNQTPILMLDTTVLLRSFAPTEFES